MTIVDYTARTAAYMGASGNDEWIPPPLDFFPTVVFSSRQQGDQINLIFIVYGVFIHQRYQKSNDDYYPAIFYSI